MLGYLLAAKLKRLGQHNHRIDAGHLGEHWDRFRPGSSHIAQGTSTFQRAGKANSLDRRMLDQQLTDPAAIDHAEHASRQSNFGQSATDRQGHTFGRGHVTTVCLEHHRAAGCQSGSGVTTGSGEGEREVAGTEDSHRADAGLVLPQIRPRQRGTPRKRGIDSGAIKITATQNLGKQPQLVDGTLLLTLNSCGRKGGFGTDQFDKVGTELIDFIGDRIQQLSPLLSRRGAETFGSLSGLLASLFNLCRSRLPELVRQGFAGGGVETLVSLLPARTPAIRDKVMTENV
ncbi:hypothetical protein FQZ97_813280 [compost metagenome]